MYYRGNQTETYGGIDFLIKTKLTHSIQVYKSIWDSVAYLLEEIDRKTTKKLIQVYAPTSNITENLLYLISAVNDVNVNNNTEGSHCNTRKKGIIQECSKKLWVRVTQTL